MRKGKVLATVLSGVMLLSAAFAVPASAAVQDLVKDGNFPAGTTAWEIVLDEGKTPEKPMQLEDGRVVLSEDNDVYQHLKQTIEVKPNVKYRFSITYTLSAGTLRLDILKPGEEKAEEHVCSNDITTAMTYNEEVTHEYDIRMADGQTEFVLDIRNNGPHGAAVGEITNISFVELDALGNPVGETTEPVDTTPPTEAPTTTAEDPSDKTEAPPESTEAPDDETQPSDAASPSESEDDSNSNSSSWLVPLIVVVAVVVVVGGGFAVWYFAIRPKKNQKS